jgi:hypothetical protein
MIKINSKFSFKWILTIFEALKLYDMSEKKLISKVLIRIFEFMNNLNEMYKRYDDLKMENYEQILKLKFKNQ